MRDESGHLVGICDPNNRKEKNMSTTYGIELVEDTETWEEINSPDHYNSNTVETIDLIRDSMEAEEYKGYLKGNIFKYVSRYRYKEKESPYKDLLKAQWYLCKLIEDIKNDG